LENLTKSLEDLQKIWNVLPGKLAAPGLFHVKQTMNILSPTTALKRA
jgi:hypothetical protein